MSDLPPQLAPALQSSLDEQLRERGTPGATVDVFLDGVPAWSGASGLRDIEAGTPLTPASLFPIYSITKTFTAVSSLRLARAGKLSLDDAISRWLPDLPFAGEVSLRQLLAHTAGVFDYSLLPRYHADLLAHPREPWRFDDFVARAARRPLDFAPGAGWSYSNTGYTLARDILERATGRSFAELVRETILDPLALGASHVLEDLDPMQALVPGYSTLFGGGKPPLRDVRPLYHPGWCGTGVLASTGPELCRFFEAIFDGSLLEPGERTQLTTMTRVPGHHPPAVEPSYGLGIMGDVAGGRKELGHGGGGPGWNLRASYWPGFHGRRLAMAVLCNHDAEDAWPIARTLTRTLDELLAPGSG